MTQLRENATKKHELQGLIHLMTLKITNHKCPRFNNNVLCLYDDWFIYFQKILKQEHVYIYYGLLHLYKSREYETHLRLNAFKITQRRKSWQTMILKCVREVVFPLHAWSYLVVMYCQWCSSLSQLTKGLWERFWMIFCLFDKRTWSETPGTTLPWLYYLWSDCIKGHFNTYFTEAKVEHTLLL